MKAKFTAFKITVWIYILVLIGLTFFCFYSRNTPRLLSLFFVPLALLLLLSIILVSRGSKKGTLKKNDFILVLIISIFQFPLTLPLLIVTVISMKKVGENAPTPDEVVAESSEDVATDEPEAPDAELDGTGFVMTGKTEQKTEKPRTNKVGFIVVSILYAALLIMSIVTFAGVNVLWDNDRALNLVTAGWLTAFCASFGLYFFLLAPFGIGGKAKKIGVLASVAGMLLLDVLPIVLLTQNADILHASKNASMFGWFDNAVLIVISMIVSEIGIVTTLLLTQARMDPEKIKKKKSPKDSKSDNFVVTVLTFLIQLIIGIFNSALALMRLKERHINAYVCLVVLLFSILCCVLSEVMVILAVVFAVGFLVMLAGKFIEFSYVPSTQYEATLRDENGKEIKVRQYAYQGSRWEDDSGNYYEEKEPGRFIKA